MKFANALFAFPGLCLFVILFAFLLQRSRPKRGPHAGKKRRGFYPSTYALGIGLQMIQTFVAPNTEYTIAEKLKEEAEQEDDGDSADPARQLERQLKRIKRGERLETLTTMLRKDD